MRSAPDWAARHLRFWEAVDKARHEPDLAQASAADRMVVVLSRQAGARGEEIAHGVAEELGYRLLDREIVDYLANTAQVRRRLVETLDERTRSSLEDWVTTLLSAQSFDQTAYLRHLATVLASIAAHGRTIVVGRGAVHLLASPFVYRVRVIAPLGQRIENIARERDLSLHEARRWVVHTDRQRESFIRRHFQRDPRDPLLYDLTVNTAGVGPTEGIAAVCAGVRARIHLLDAARQAPRHASR